MKKLKTFSLTIVLIVSISSVYSQKYKKASDSVKLNKEYVEVSNDIAELTSKLTIAQNNLPGYRAKEGDATSEAQTSAEESKRAATKATSGDVGDAKKAKKEAGEALNKAEDAKDANRETKKQNKKISKLKDQLQKKQERLQKLEEMRIAIRASAQ